MANSIVVTTAAFSTALMKPVPDEQIDALWGQNIADNTGYLYNQITTKKVPGPCFGFSRIHNSSWLFPARGTHFFEKSPGMATFFGSFIGSVSSTGNVEIRVRMNGTTIFNQNANGTLYSLAIGTDLAGIADGVMVPVTWHADVYSGSPLECDFAFTGWQKP